MADVEEDSSRQPGRRAVFERETEIKALDDALTQLCTEQAGGLLFFAGAAGLGKTTLLAEARSRAGARGCCVLWARGGEQEQELAFHVVRQLVQPALAPLHDEEHRQMLGNWYDIVAPAIGLAPVSSTVPDPQGVREGLDWVMTRIAVRHEPVVMVVDDAHWMDAESLAWLTAFAPRAAELPMLVVIAYRSDDLPYRSEPFRTLAGRQGSRPYDLMALTPKAVGRMVRAAVGEGADESFCRECWAVTSGNPFEVNELTAKIADRGLKPQQENVPRLRELATTIKGSGLIEHLGRLGTSAVRLAWAAAVLGTRISPEIAADVAAIGRKEAAEAQARLHAARILSGGTGDGDPLEFFHPLIATSVYQSIPPAMRVALHGKAASVVADAGQGVTAAARHLLEVHPEGDPQVVSVLREAAKEYLRAGAPDAAHRCLARALREPPALADRPAVLFELGCASPLTEPKATVNHLRAALEEPELTSALRESVTYRLAQALAHCGRLDEAVAILDAQARRSTSTRVRLRLLAEQFTWNAFRAEEPDVAARSRRLARLAERLPGRGLAERYILGLRAWDAMLRGESAATALHYAEEALGDGLSWTDDSWGFEVPSLVALTFMYCDQPGRAEEQFKRGIAECDRKGWRGAHMSYGFSFLGFARYRRGRLDEAEDLVREGMRFAERMAEGGPAHWTATGVLIQILLARGRYEEAERMAETHNYGRGRPGAVVYPDSQAVLGELLLALGRKQEAEQQLAAAGCRLERRGMRNPSWCPWRLHLALAQAGTAPERAMAQAEEAVERARQFGAASPTGQALRVAAQVSQVSGEASGRELLAESVRQLERSPASYELACALIDHGAALRRADLPQQAADQLYRGLEVAAHCASDALVQRARAELSAAGLRPLELGDSTGSDNLTSRERQAAELAGRGWTDTRIARGLDIQEETVARLLSGVYRKIGTDRAGLPSAFSRRGDADPATDRGPFPPRAGSGTV